MPFPDEEAGAQDMETEREGGRRPEQKPISSGALPVESVGNSMNQERGKEAGGLNKSQSYQVPFP